MTRIDWRRVALGAWLGIVLLGLVQVARAEWVEYGGAEEGFFEVPGGAWTSWCHSDGTGTYADPLPNAHQCSDDGRLPESMPTYTMFCGEAAWMRCYYTLDESDLPLPAPEGGGVQHVHDPQTWALINQVAVDVGRAAGLMGALASLLTFVLGYGVGRSL